MAQIKTPRGYLEYTNHLLYLGDHKANEKVLIENLKILSGYLDKIDINWGPAFGTLIGIVRSDSLLSWASVFNIYILKEDEERFKEVLWNLFEAGFRLVRYERRGLYYLEKDGEYFKVFVLHKISSDVRHTGGIDFIHETYIQNTTKWDFHGIALNVPIELDDYLSFQYDDWLTPKQYPSNNVSPSKLRHWLGAWVQDNLPNNLYYEWLRLHRLKDFNRFKTRCEQKGRPLPANVELSNIRPRRYKRVLTVGVYDLIHKGHIELFRRAKGLGDYLIVAVQDSDYILKYKPQSTILNTTDDRMFMVKSVRFVDETIVYYDVDKIVQEVDFDVFVTGPDQCHNGFQRAIKWCEEHGKEHVVLGRTEGVSSSELKARIAEKRLKNK